MRDMDARLLLRLELCELQDLCSSALDNDRLEAWTDFFTEDCRYEIIPKENVDAGLPAPVIYCRNRKMLRDRVLSLRNANIYEGHTYRHMTSGLVVGDIADDGSIATTSSYVVINTGQAGESTVYQAGCYHDEVVRVDGALRYRKRRVVYDTSRVQTLLATPI
jgi:anthranilate 1,2-dioxygenase small subunit